MHAAARAGQELANCEDEFREQVAWHVDCRDVASGETAPIAKPLGKVEQLVIISAQIANSILYNIIICICCKFCGKYIVFWMLKLPFHRFRFEICLAEFPGFNAKCCLIESIAFYSSQAHQVHDVSDLKISQKR